MRKSEASSIGFLEDEFSVTQAEVAKRLGISRRQVQRIEARALRKIADAAKRSPVIREMLGLDL